MLGLRTANLNCLPSLTGRERLESRVSDEGGCQEFPADSNSMSLTCQLLPDPVTVTAYCALAWLVPLEVASRWPAVTTNVMLDGPNARSELITAVPVETCFWSLRSLATPEVP